MIISARDIKKKFGTLEVLRGISLDIPEGQMVCITGASGAGKTTLLQILGSLDRPSSGTVLLNGQDLFAMNKKSLSAFRNRHIGFIFQFHQLLPEFTALENVCIPGWIGGRNKTEVKDEAEALLGFLGLEQRLMHKPGTMSGGEQQRVAVARALINNPSVVFADEPSGNLDSRNAAELHDYFIRLRDERKQTFIVVTHNDLLAGLGNRIIRMQDGMMADA
jgi:lipoprotein-releasing system ATP-binding protein